MTGHYESRIGVVIIGRNEGERLKQCLQSVLAQREACGPIIYVDSGSTDGSVDYARSVGVEVVELDISRPFTMARGRNAGFRRLMELEPTTRFVQFVDGDCQVCDGYLEAARQALIQRDDVAVVCGRRRERYPEASIYNRLCDMEWGRTLGEIDYCGGDMMVRAEVFRKVGMFNEAMIAGEEPEMCVRIRRAHGKIMRIDHDMTWHDAAMSRFSQWWRRAMRGGHAYADGAALHGKQPTRHNVRQVRSALFWGVAVPFVIVACGTVGFWWYPAWFGAATAIAGYPILGWKVARGMRRRGYDPADARLYAAACVIAKFPGALGIGRYWWNRSRRNPSTLIEYKTASINHSQSFRRVSSGNDVPAESVQ